MGKNNNPTNEVPSKKKKKHQEMSKPTTTTTISPADAELAERHLRMVSDLDDDDHDDPLKVGWNHMLNSRGWR